MPKIPGPAGLMPSLRRVVLKRDEAERSDGQLLTAFVRHGDADAFAALVRRHGPMVLGVARRVIGDPHAADDAFQAAFIVLARRAASVRPREQVGNWLYGVAYRTALKARAVRVRRRGREKQVDAMPEPPAKATPDRMLHGSPEWSDLQPIIDEELARLPDKLRLPVVLCDLEGRPQRTVAKQLGVAPATLAARLAAARRTLAGRLQRRGIGLSGGALAVVLGHSASTAAVAPSLAEAAVRAAEACAAGAIHAAHGLVSAQAIQLSEGVMRMMLLAKLKTAGIAALALFTVAGGFGFGLLPAHAGDAPKSVPAAQTPPAAKAAAFDAALLGKLKEGVNRPNQTDAEFLRRLNLDLLGLMPTPLELKWFIKDPDENKRVKVIDWMLGDDAAKKHLGTWLKIDPSRIRVERFFDERTGKLLRVTVVIAPEIIQSSVLMESLDLGVGMRYLCEQAGTPSVAVGDGVTVQDALYWIDAQQTPQAKIEGEFNPNSKPQPAPKYQAVGSDFDFYYINTVEPDAEFLRRVLLSARGSAPTTLERKYFTEDKNPRKREKLLDLLLEDAALAKKLGSEWKRKMLEAQPPYRRVMQNASRTVRVNAANDSILFLQAAREPNKMDKLVGELMAAKKSDEQMLEAIALAAAGRLPTAEEKRATLVLVVLAPDKKAAWIALARAFAADRKIEAIPLFDRDTGKPTPTK